MYSIRPGNRVHGGRHDHRRRRAATGVDGDTFAAMAAGFAYNTCRDCNLTLGAATRPASVTLNGKASPFTWNAEKSAVVLGITKGDGTVVVR